METVEETAGQCVTIMPDKSARPHSAAWRRERERGRERERRRRRRRRKEKRKKERKKEEKTGVGWGKKQNN